MALSRACLSYVAVIGTALVLWVLAASFGGFWAFAALFYITLGIAVLDVFTAGDLAEDGSETEARVIAITLGLVHLGVIIGTVAALAWGPADVASKLALFGAAGLYLGQVSNANAHELIHARDRLRRWIGMMNYTTLWFGHHVTAHPGIHHVHVATPLDPNSARRGKSFWRFFPQCWMGAFRAGLALEFRRLRVKNRGPWHITNPYWRYIGGAFSLTIAVWAVFGGLGLWAYLSLCLFAQTQLILSDYVQHYGLRRKELANGKYAPQGPEHSWDTPHWASSALMLNASRHADHHMNPGRGFHALKLPRDAPQHPYPLPVMAVIALIPPLWRRVVHRSLDRKTASATWLEAAE